MNSLITNQNAEEAKSEANKHSGWSKAEDELLFAQVRLAREEGRPLKSVFDTVAHMTGRKPNSIRNYYYVRIRDAELAHLSEGMGRATAFVPFSDDEVREMLRFILHEQARGASVRACTLMLGGNDNKAMLRYQNKYRSVIKNNPQLVREVMQEMTDEGLAVYDPYVERTARQPGRPRKHVRENLLDSVSEAVRRLEQTEGIDAAAFFENIAVLASCAARGAEASRRLEELEGGSSDRSVCDLIEDNRELKALVDNQLGELKMQKERFDALLDLFRQLMNVNREFLGLTGAVKVSNLGSYIRELSRNVEDCERLIVKYIG